MIRLFLRGWLIVTLTACNVSFIAGQHYPAALLTGFCISYVWYGNTGRATDDRSWRAQAIYATGAAVGTVTGMALAGLFR